MRACPTHVALLRGINVGGRNRVAMADLREVVTSLGHTEVTTYVQSGNVVHQPGCGRGRAGGGAGAADRRAAERAPAAGGAVSRRAGGGGRGQPVPGRDEPQVPARTVPRHRVRSRRGPRRRGRAAARCAAGQPGRGARGRAHVVPAPDGLGRSELAAQLARTGADTTARNWATVTKLLARLDA